MISGSDSFIALSREIARLARRYLAEATAHTWPMRFSIGFDAQPSMPDGKVLLMAWASDIKTREGYYASASLAIPHDGDVETAVEATAWQVGNSLEQQVNEAVRNRNQCSPAANS